MFTKKEAEPIPVVEDKKENPTPAYLREDYPYKTHGEPITDLDSLIPTGVLYEIKCPKCEMSIRAQAVNIKPTYKRLMNENGCIGCGNKELTVKEVDTGKIKKTEI